MGDIVLSSLFAASPSKTLAALIAQAMRCWRVYQIYGRRMTIEQLFRYDKIKRNGWSPRDTKITRPGNWTD